MRFPASDWAGECGALSAVETAVCVFARRAGLPNGFVACRPPIGTPDATGL